MRCSIIYYSKTGHTAEMAREIEAGIKQEVPDMEVRRSPWTMQTRNL